MLVYCIVRCIYLGIKIILNPALFPRLECSHCKTDNRVAFSVLINAFSNGEKTVSATVDDHVNAIIAQTQAMRGEIVHRPLVHNNKLIFVNFTNKDVYNYKQQFRYIYFVNNLDVLDSIHLLTATHIFALNVNEAGREKFESYFNRHDRQSAAVPNFYYLTTH